MKNLIIFVVCLFPVSRLKNAILNFLGLNIAKNSLFFPNIVWKVRTFVVGDCATIRSFNVFRDVEVEVGRGAIIGSFNWFSSAPALSYLPNFKGFFKLGEESVINSRNYFDCSGGIEFGNYSDLAGVRSIFISHQINYECAIQSCDQIVIGNYCLISANVKITPGVVIEDACLVAMSSVLPRGLYKSGHLYAGSPARLKKPVKGNFFTRKTGKIQ